MNSFRWLRKTNDATAACKQCLYRSRDVRSPKGEVGESRNDPHGPMRVENRDRCAYFGRAKRTSEMEYVCGVFEPWESQLLPSSHTYIKADGWRRGEILLCAPTQPRILLPYPFKSALWILNSNPSTVEWMDERTVSYFYLQNTKMHSQYV